MVLPSGCPDEPPEVTAWAGTSGSGELLFGPSTEACPPPLGGFFFEVAVEGTFAVPVMVLVVVPVVVPVVVSLERPLAPSCAPVMAPPPSASALEMTVELTCSLASPARAGAAKDCGALPWGDLEAATGEGFGLGFKN